MARPPRIEYPDAIHHVTARGTEQRDIVTDNRDRSKWLSLLQRTATVYRWRTFSFALMNTHYHLFVQTPDANLSEGMHYFNGGYAGYFNWRHSRSGHLFDGRYRTVLVEGEGHWLEVSRYIHLNPVRAGIVRRPEDWPWSTCRGYVHASRRFAWVDYGRVLADFGGDTRSGRYSYKAFVEEGVRSRPESPLLKAVQGIILGSQNFVEKIRGLLAKPSQEGGRPESPHLRKRLNLDDVIAQATAQFGGDASHWKRRRRCDDLARAVAAYVARQTTGLRVAEIAAGLGYRNASSVSVACRRAEREMRHLLVAQKIQRMLSH